MKSKILIVAACLFSCLSCTKKEPSEPVEKSGAIKDYAEKYRPQLHFSPPSHWMNDPNGLVYDQGEYHLFYQHYPEDKVWGPMHWGHAVTKDLVHWTNLPIALYPDSLGMIFSGSAVVDKSNSSGFGTPTSPPMVAMFTLHNAEREKAGHNDFETQGIAYSTDKGRTWTKYKNNPVIKNPGTRDFRDPKMSWHDPSKQWITTLVAGDHAEFYGSTDLKSWKKLSEFGKAYGAHGGVWECPDLFPLTVEGESTQKWILIININPGGPNGGSATQYFIGDFNGREFKCDSDKSKILWIDHGPDNYAGITWSNTPGDRKLFIGWMSNWSYAQNVPTDPWRSANTITRELKLLRIDGGLVVASDVVPELSAAASGEKDIPTVEVRDSLIIATDLSANLIKGVIDAKDWTMKLSNSKGEHVSIGFESVANRYFIDRSTSGDTTFSKPFRDRSYAPRISKEKTISLSMVIDVSSVEVFFDNGATVMTSLFFPDSVYNKLVLIPGSAPVNAASMHVETIPGIW